MVTYVQYNGDLTWIASIRPIPENNDLKFERISGIG
jgi:hypothetical protein